MQIKCVNPGINYTWSERLNLCLSHVRTNYILFSLEDFFLLDQVKSSRIEQCIEWMNENSNIAVCRLTVSNDRGLKPTTQYNDFYTAGSEVGFRLDTQFALWNKEALSDFLDLSENPWEFEELGTKRILGTDKLFLWKYADNDYDLDNMIIPYRINQKYGYGIAWGKWLWNDRKWFESNGIYHVNYNKLGILSERSVKRRFQYLYNPHPNNVGKIIQSIYKVVIKIEKCFQNIRIYGFNAGMKENLKAYKRRK